MGAGQCRKGNVRLCPAQIIAGGWKAPYKGETYEIYERLNALGVTAWDLAHEYKFFGPENRLLKKGMPPIDPEGISGMFKFGKHLKPGDNFDRESATIELNRFLDSCGLPKLHTVMPWMPVSATSLPHYLEWACELLERKLIKTIGFSNISPEYAYLVRNLIQQRDIPLVAQVRSSKLLGNGAEISDFVSLGFEVQAYGMLHSGLVYGHFEGKHQDYLKEYQRITEAGVAQTINTAELITYPIVYGATSVIAAFQSHLHIDLVESLLEHGNHCRR